MTEKQLETPVTSPSVEPAASPQYNPTPHKHDVKSITGLRVNKENGRVEPLYDAIDVYANGQLIALYNAATLTGVGAAEPIQVTLSITQIEAEAASAAKANSAEEVAVGVAGRGEVPQEGPLEKTTPSASEGAYSTAGGFPAKLDPGADPSKIFVVLGKNMDACLSDAKKGAWTETGSNSRILGCFKAVGFNVSNDKTTPWCAAFAGSILKASGVQALKTLSSLAYKGYGTPVPINDKSKWRLNDIIVFSRKGGGHIGFFRGYNPANGVISVLGGNQDNRLKLSNFSGKGEFPVVSVSRAWTVPPEYDKEVTYSGTSDPNIKVT